MTRIDPAEAFGDRADTGAATRSARWFRAWNLVVLLVLLVGSTFSALGALAWHDYVHDQAASAFSINASSVSAAVSTSLRRDIDFVATQRGGVMAIPNLTNRELALWYKSVDITQRFPGGVGFAFVQRVLPSQLSAFEAEVVADPPVNEPVTAPYVVFPPGQRSRYCLQRFGIATSAPAKLIPSTFDFCGSTIPPGNSPSPIPSLLDEATASGRTTALAAGRIAKTGGIADLFVTFTPVYDNESTPGSVAARQAGIHGWIVATFSGDALLDASLKAQPHLAVSVIFDQPGAGPVTIASSGRAPRGALFARTLRFSAGGSWAVRVVGSGQSAATVQAVGVGSLGLAVTALVFLLFLLLTRSRAMALQLVDKRTRQLRHLALYDPLTDLPNRALLLDRAEQMLIRAKRHPLVVGALFIDLDEFKEVNDTLGHQAGDRLLRAVGARLSGTLRASDTVGRLGGDEFVVLVEGELGGIGPEIVAQQILAELAKPFTIDGVDAGPLHIKASIGVAVGSRRGPADLLRDADVALYVAKERGDHGYVVFHPQMHMDLSDGPVPAGGPGESPPPGEPPVGRGGTPSLEEASGVDDTGPGPADGVTPGRRNRNRTA